MTTILTVLLVWCGLSVLFLCWWYQAKRRDREWDAMLRHHQRAEWAKGQDGPCWKWPYRGER
jgi:hypothetical protein